MGPRTFLRVVQAIIARLPGIEHSILLKKQMRGLELKVILRVIRYEKHSDIKHGKKGFLLHCLCPSIITHHMKLQRDI